MTKHLDLLSVDQNSDDVMIHEPPKFQKIPEFHYAPSRSGTRSIPGLLARKKHGPPLLLILAIALFTVPGVIQGVWSEDGRVGDIVNACIGVGSVLVSVLFSVLYCMFNTTVFSVRSFSVNALKGEFLVTNDFAARVLLSDDVKKLESVSCDPRLPKRLIANISNCAVRSPKGGWLAIGKSIKYDQMINHGYYIIKEKWMVLDLIECSVLKCVKQKNDKIVHIIRDAKQNYLFERVHSFEGDEVFAGFGLNQ